VLVGWYVDPDTDEMVWDDSWKYFVALPPGECAVCARFSCKHAVSLSKSAFISVLPGMWSSSRGVAMRSADYVNCYGETIALDGLDSEERRLVARLRRRAQSGPGWCEFSDFAVNLVGAFYDKRGVSRKQARLSPVLRIALDLSSRLGIAEGKIAPPTFDYREQLERLVLLFPTRRAFCKAAGISQNMLSHCLAGRKDLSMSSVSQALKRIGYRIDFVPQSKAKAGHPQERLTRLANQ
jgi:hypothetical protein